MGWHYQIRKRRLNGELWFDMVEVYDHGWTVDGIEPGGDTPEEVIRDLQRMLADAHAYPVLDDDDLDTMTEVC
ncbi:MAG: hypothetical protein VW577_05360 [Pelagibacteraceae bacterium]